MLNDELDAREQILESAECIYYKYSYKKERRQKLEVERNATAFYLNEYREFFCKVIKDNNSLKGFFFSPTFNLNDKIERLETKLYALNKKLRRDIFDESFYKVY